MDIQDRIRVVEEAKSWLKTPWHHQANKKGVGVDCAMFLRMVYINAGIIKPFDVDNYKEQWFLHRDEERFLSFMNRFGKEINNPKPGDAIIFKYGRCFSHGAIVIEYPIIIHSYRPSKYVVYDDITCSSDLKVRDRKSFEVVKWLQ
jgi:cell wall-associated NlpC family hydrolase